MSDIDWSTAPEGATHFEVGSENPWEKHGDGNPMFFAERRNRWLALGPVDVSARVARPVVTTWEGGGFPPVGTVCKYRFMTTNKGGDTTHSGTCEILGYRHNIVWIAPTCAKQKIVALDVVEFTPIKTERERVIDEISAAYFEGARGHMGGIAGIYEAGFRKVQS